MRKEATAGMLIFNAASSALFQILRQHIRKQAAGYISAWRIMVYARVYLKVCEGCGGLWFRAQGGTSVYCAACESRLRSFSRPGKRRSGRPRKHTRHLSIVKGGAQ